MMTDFKRPPAPLTAVPDVELVPTFDARDLVKNGTQARLQLDSQTYTLRITRAGKLILTK